MGKRMLLLCVLIASTLADDPVGYPVRAPYNGLDPNIVQGYCYYNDMMIEVGTQIGSAGGINSCETITCEPDGIISSNGCGVTNLGTGCRWESDILKPFPACCQVEVCDNPDDEEE